MIRERERYHVLQNVGAHSVRRAPLLPRIAVMAEPISWTNERLDSAAERVAAGRCVVSVEWPLVSPLRTVGPRLLEGGNPTDSFG